MARLTLLLLTLSVLLTSAYCITLGVTQKPLRPKPTPRTPKPASMFQDGKMDETGQMELEEADPVTLPAKTQKVAAAAPAATAPPEPVVDESNVAIYKLLGSSGSACILFKVDAVLAFKFKTVHNEETEKDLYVPNQLDVTGECGSGDAANMMLSWKDFSLTLYFTKTPGGERWYVEKVDLFVNTDNHHVFEHIQNPGRRLHLGTPGGNAQLFPTPVGKSYACNQETNVELSKGDVKATLILRSLQIQPFIFRKGEFGQPFLCTPPGQSFRDETAPIAVGSTLAIVVLCTVTGYGVWRYFKIKKVQYDTME